MLAAMPPSIAARGPRAWDAALGTRLIALGLDLARDDPALWNLDHPGAIDRLHRADVEAGAQALTTNTFGAGRVWLDRYGRGDDWRRAIAAAVRLARAAAGPDRLVVGSIGPAAEPAGEVAAALVDNGADAILLETHAPGNILPRLEAVACRVGVPCWASLFRWGDDPEGLARRLEGAGASAIGINCAGMDEAVALLPRLRAAAALPLLAKPGAGPPGGPLMAPEEFAAAVPALMAVGGVGWIGGCCGTTEAHLQSMRRVLAGGETAGGG